MVVDLKANSASIEIVDEMVDVIDKGIHLLSTLCGISVE